MLVAFGGLDEFVDKPLVVEDQGAVNETSDTLGVETASGEQSPKPCAFLLLGSGKLGFVHEFHVAVDIILDLHASSSIS